MSNSLLEGLANAGKDQAKTEMAKPTPPVVVAPVVKPTAPPLVTEKVKSITMTKLGSGPWTFAFQGDIRNRDINMLRIRFVHAFKKLKVKGRLSRMREQRKVENNGNK